MSEDASQTGSCDSSGGDVPTSGRLWVDEPSPVGAKKPTAQLPHGATPPLSCSALPRRQPLRATIVCLQIRKVLYFSTVYVRGVFLSQANFTFTWVAFALGIRALSSPIPFSRPNRWDGLWNGLPESWTQHHSSRNSYYHKKQEHHTN